jgi:phage-related minor tail protein
MNLGSAVIEFMPVLPPTALNNLTSVMTSTGAKAGLAGGKAMSDGVTQGTRSIMPELERVFGQAGTAGGKALTDNTVRATKSIMPELERVFGQAGQEAGKAGATEAAKSFEGGFKDNIGKITAIGAGIGVGVAGGIAGAMDLSSANEKMRAQLNLNGPESARLGKAAGELYSSNYGESMSDVSDAIAKVVQNIPSLRDASVPVLKDVAAGALDIARVFDQDVGGTTRAVGQLMRTGLAPDAQSALDLITTGLQKVPGAGEDLLDTFNEYGVQFQKLGLDGPQALGLINQLMEGGARNTDLAADAIKEFSIRAVDGSKLSADGFKALGLNAEDMTAAIAKGGPSAEKSFATVLDKLNSIEDPVKRNAAGVALFGTQWEDLGDAFRKADLDTAAASLGKVGGATKGIVDQSATANLQGFMREIQAGFVELIGNQVIPIVRDFGKWIQDNQTTVKTAAVVIGVFTAAVVSYNVAVGIASAATKAMAVATAIFNGVARAVAIAQNLWAVAQWALNAAMAANPIGLVVVAIAALVAAIVIAYKNSETFRSIVQAVWGAIKVAIGAVADWFVKTVWPALKTALDALGQAFSWLNTNVIQPVWTAIKLAISVAWATIKVLFDAGKLYIQALAAVFTWLWQNIITPVWAGIKLQIQIAWVAIQIIFKTIEIAIRALALVFQWLWTNVIVPVWNGIRSTIMTVWNWLKTNIFDPAIAFIRGALSTVWTVYSTLVNTVWGTIKTSISAAWTWVKDKVLTPLIDFIKGTLSNAWETAKTNIVKAWEAIKSPIQTTWTWIQDKVFNPLKTFITQTIPNAFTSGVSAVKTAWSKIQEAAAAPVKFVVNTVINGGIIKGFNWIADKVGVGGISPISLNFADGGVMPGYTPGRDVHKFVGPTGTLNLSGGEAILRPELTKELGAEFVHAGNRAARTGQTKQFLKGFLNHGAQANFADGGIFGGIKKAAGSVVGGISKAWDTFTDPVGTFKSTVSSLMGGMPGGPFMKDVLHATINKLVDGVSSWISDKFSSFMPALTGGPASGGSGGNLVAFGRWLQSQGYQVSEHPAFGGVTPGAHVNGSKHYVGRAIDVNHGAGTSATEQRFLAAIIGRAHAMGLHSIFMSAGHFNHAHFDYKNGGVYDQGGWLNSGSIAVNMSKKPEAVLTAEESAGLKAMGTDKLVGLLEELIEAVKEVAPGVGSHIRGSGRGLITKARQA